MGKKREMLKSSLQANGMLANMASNLPDQRMLPTTVTMFREAI